MKDKKSFGAMVRRRREEKKIGLRQMARMIGVSPTYLSKVERDEFDPPTEENVVKIAKFLGMDEDELIALARRTPAELQEIIRERPREMADLLRTARHLEGDALGELLKQAKRAGEGDAK